MFPKEVLLVKTDGTKELYEPHKLRNSLVRAGAGNHSADKVLTDVADFIEERLKNKRKSEITVTELYRTAFDCLKKYAGDAALRYSLKRSIFELGPTGFPFEKYIAHIFSEQGFETLTGQMVMGNCVPHEVDLVAWNKEKLVMGEVKYHNDQASKTDLKVALYVSARYADIKGNVFDYGGVPRKISDWYLITNTKFTDTAITYATCNGVNLLSWTFPEDNNLHDMIEDTKSHPITCLTAISNIQKKMLIDKDIILCRQLHKNIPLMKDLGLDMGTIERALEEVNIIIQPK